MVNRLSGGRKREVRYEHEKRSFKVEYEGAVGRRAGVNGQLPSASSSTEEDNTSPMIECEIRCDLDTWASSLDIVIDPPPQSVTCLRRHRISAAGGGLWITIVHDAVFVGDERVLVVIRRGHNVGTGTGTVKGDRDRDRGLVMVNGARVPVDVEEMSETEIKSMTRQKRVKPPRVPLDQPPVVNAVRKRKIEWDASSSDGTLLSSSPPEGSSIQQKSETTWATAPLTSSPLARFFTYAVDQATQSTQQAVAAITPGAVDVPSPDKPPMQHALDAFAWAQYAYSHSSSSNISSSSPSSSSSSPEGWTFVSDKQGIVVGRALDPRISRNIHVHTASKVIQGVSAEEIAGVVSEFECRKKWDDRLGEARPLLSFGAGAGTAFVTSRAGFPFRDRGLYLANAQVRVNGMSAPVLGRTRSGSGSAGGGVTRVPSTASDTTSSSTSGGNRSILFHVSASYNPSGAAEFNPTKYNSYALPIGRVFIDAWVLETLDPYTKENYAIPSTRCTRYVAVDYAGSIPYAANVGINATLPRSSILAVEAYFTARSGAGSVPMTRLPAAGALVVERGGRGGSGDRRGSAGGAGSGGVGGGFGSAGVNDGAGWRMRRRDESRVLVGTRFWTEDGRYRSVILVKMDKGGKVRGKSLLRGSTLLSTPTSTPTKGTRTPLSESTFVPPDTPPAAPTPDSMTTPTMPSLSPTTALPTLQLSPSPASTSISGLRARSSSSAFTVKGELRQATDLVVGEIVLDSKLYPKGYTVHVESRLLGSRDNGKVDLGNVFSPESSSSASSLSTSMPDHASSSFTSALPISYTVYSLPPSPHHSSGDRATRHLIRLTLPTAQYQISTVEDPLTGEVRGAPTRPAWLVDMQEGGVGAVVGVEVRGCVVDSAARGAGKKGTKGVLVKNEKESLGALGRDELVDERVGMMPVLSRWVYGFTLSFWDRFVFRVCIGGGSRRRLSGATAVSARMASATCAWTVSGILALDSLRFYVCTGGASIFCFR